MRCWRCLDDKYVHRVTAGFALWAAALVLACGSEIVRPEEPLTVTEVTPARGTLTGDGALEIAGTGFSDVVRITVGDAEVPFFIVRSPTRVTALVPRATTPGAADLVVTSRRHATATCAACFRYYDPGWTVTGISPDTGSLEGGMRVTISGTGFGEVTGVTIGGVALDSITVVSDSAITGITPAQADPGARDVVIASAYAGTQTCHGCFTYQLDVEVQPLAAGGWHTCALAGSGEAYCWGANWSGQLGDGTTASRSAPAIVSGDPLFRAITTGDHHTCALTPSGTAYCWGWNAGGQLGDGSLTDRSTPVRVLGNLTFSRIAADGDFTCGLTRSRVPYCWGWGGFAQLGNGSYLTRKVPVPVSGNLTFRDITTGHHHGCGVTPSGVAYCWGYGRYGQLGDGSSETRTAPVMVSGGLTFGPITAGGNQTCGLDNTMRAYCWGVLQSGYSSTSAPAAVSGDLRFTALDAGYLHACGITSTAAAYCWGWNQYGQVGDSSTTIRQTPVPVWGNVGFSHLSGGQYHTCGIATSGGVFCWGQNTNGQLGNGTLENSAVPVAVSPFGTSPSR